MRIIVVAGLTVAAGTSALVVATLDVFKALGPGLGVTVVVGLLVSITFIPACLALLGARIFWPRNLQAASAAPAPGRLRALVGRVAGLPGALTVAIARHRIVALEAVILEDPPLGARAIATLRRLVSNMPDLLRAAGLLPSSAAFAGSTALASETIQRTVDDLQRIAAVVLLVDLLLLAIFLRALVAPLYLMAASLLGFVASLGLATLVFQVLFDQGSFSFFVPFASAVLLVSLGSDYNIFLVGRVWEEAKTVPLRTAVARAAPRASGAIAIAGITLAASFAILVLIPLAAFRQFGITMAAGILIDTFVVRAFLVPALMSLVGEKSAWPGRPSRGSASRES
jgi:putative drug exporter of the RND superfamily